eukprot:g12593.t1
MTSTEKAHKTKVITAAIGLLTCGAFTTVSQSAGYEMESYISDPDLIQTFQYPWFFDAIMFSL